jgi:hypothetical protein
MRRSVGQSVKPDPAKAAEDVAAEEQLPINDIISGEWSTKASFADQFVNVKWQNDCRPGVEKVGVFKLPDQQDEVNKLFARAHPPGSPQIAILRREPLLAKGTIMLFVLYQEIEYRRILPNPEPST